MQCQRDLCNWGYDNKNWDPDGYFGQGSLVTSNETVYELPVLGRLLSLHNQVVSSILKVPQMVLKFLGGGKK
jgi:hypothetical protein